MSTHKKMSKLKAVKDMIADEDEDEDLFCDFDCDACCLACQRTQEMLTSNGPNFNYTK